MIPNSQAAFVADLVRRDNSALRARVRALMDADSIPDLAAVSTRTTFAIAAATLLNEIKGVLGFGWQESPGLALHSESNVRAFRIAVTFRVTTSNGWLRPFVIEDIWRVARGRNRTLAMRARIALACLGEIDWRKKAALETQKKQRDLSREFVTGKLDATAYLDASQKITRDASEQITAFSRLGIATRNADGSLRDTHAVMLDMADVFHDMPDGANKSALAMEVFGRDGARMVPFLSQGSAALKQLEADSRRVAPAFTDLQKSVGSKFSDAFDVFRKAADSAQKSFFLLFAPSMTRLIQTTTEFIARNRATLLEFGSALAARVEPVIDRIVALLSSNDANTGAFLDKASAAILNFASAAQHAITDIIIPAFASLLTVLDTVATAINGVFGTSLSGQEIGIALIVTKMIGLFGVLTSAVRVVISAVGLLVAAFGGVNAAIILIGVALGVLLVNAVGGLQGIQDAWTATWTAIQAFVLGVFDSLKAAALAVGETLGAIWNALVEATVAAGAAIVSAFQDALNTVTGFFTSLVDDATSAFSKIIDGAKAVGRAIAAAFSGGGGGQGQGAPGFAAGGHVRGPGTGTSDSIMARLSNGEYVIPKRAVDFFGVRFFDAIRRLGDPMAALGARFNQLTVADLVPRFATGGLVSSFAMPDIGGLAIAGGLTPVNLHFNGQKVGQLFGTSDAIRQLSRESAGAQIRSAGRKPAWFKG